MKITLRRECALLLGTLLIVTLGCFISARAQTVNVNSSANPVSPKIEYTVSMSQPYTHLLEVAMRVELNSGNRAAATDLVFPVWTPGSYLIREYARHLQDFTASDASGKELKWQKTNKNTWHVENGAAQDFTIKYRVYANELTVRTNELNDRHAFWNNAALLMYPQGALKAPSTLRVIPFGDWRVATGLPQVAANTYRAENFDVLYDSPFEVSDFVELKFEARNVPHRIVISGAGNYDPQQLTTDVKKIVEAAFAMMGDPPYKDYTFILHLRAAGGGGLEHLNSTALISRRNAFTSPADYRGFLTLVAHEYFHLWNVKRIRPDALGPFDYTQENYTKLLWVAEGITAYYENILVLRAGLMSDRQFLREIAGTIANVQNKPGRLVLSAEEASFDAWIKYYRPDENAANSQISYYDKGALLGFLLDLEIRGRSKGAKSLDDVMRYLYAEFFKKGRNYTPNDFQKAAELAAGGSLDEFFSRYVRGRAELDYNTALKYAGLKLETESADKTAQAYFGADMAQDGNRLLVRRIMADTPAYNQGINAGDEIVAVDGMRASLTQLNAYLADKRPNDEITLTLFRTDDLRTFKIKLGGRIEPDYRIVQLPAVSEEQMKIYQGWTRS